MSFNYNHITLVGRVGSHLLTIKKDGISKVSFELAIDRPYRKDDGGVESDYVTIEMWAKLGDIASKYLSVGSPVLVEGRLQVNRENDEILTVVIAENFQVLEPVKQ